MSNTINWGKIYEKTAWGIGVINNISWGKIYATLAGSIPSFALDFSNIANDFTFTRSSFATRVNEFGLIETVTDLGSDLVQNGDFEELSAELVTNGSFDTDSDWSLNDASVTISDGTLNFSNSPLNKFATQGNTVVGKTYKVQFTIVSIESGSVRMNCGNEVTSDYSSVGTYTEYVTSTNTVGWYVVSRTAGTTAKIDNVSVKQVDPNDEWSFSNAGGTKGWRIADGRAICDELGVANGRNLDSSIVLTSGVTYKLTLDILQSADNMQVYVGATQLTPFLPTGTNLGYEYIINGSDHTGGIFRIFGGSSDTQEIDNLVIKEVLEDDIPRIDYTDATFDVPVLGNELVDYSAIGSPTGGWSLVNGKWFFDDVTSGRIDTDNFDVVVGEQYEVTVDVTISSGNANFRFTSGNAQTILFDYTDFPNGVTKFVATVTGADGSVNRLFSATALVDNPFTLNSISVKEVNAYTTTDKGSFLLEPQSTNLLSYSEDFSQWVPNGSTLNLVSGVAPDGSTSVYELTSDGTGGKLQIAISGLSVNTQYTFSFYVKQLSATTSVQSRVLSQTGGSGGSNLTSVNYQDQLVTDEWVRITHTFTTNDTLGNYFVYVSNSLTAGESLQFWGGQVEALPYATSYIPTNGSTVTRSAESCVKNNLSTDGIFGGKVGTLFLHTTDMAVVLTSLNNITPFRLYRQLGDSYRLYYEPDASFIGGNIDLSANGGELKMAFSISETDVNIYVNGSLHVSYTYVNPLPSDLGRWVWSTETKYKERVKDFKIYDKALTDEELIKITSI
jgi:hypothetical protein